MLIALVFFGLFYFNGTHYGENPKNIRGLLYSVVLAFLMLIILTLFEAGPQIAGMASAMSALGFYGGYKKAKLK